MDVYTTSSTQILEMELSYKLASVATLAILVISLFVRWRNSRCNERLPPGSLGLPIIGETIQFLIPGSSFDISPFISTRIKRYGTIFKTRILGWAPIVVSADEEFNEMIYQQDGKLFQAWFPESLNKIIDVNSLRGEQLLFNRLKTIMREYLGQKRLKEVLIGDFAKRVRCTLATWAQLPSIDLMEAVSTMLFDSLTTKLLGYAESSSTLDDLRKNVFTARKGFNSFPLNIPGTSYYKSLKGRKAAMKILKETLKQRMSTPEVQYGDIWDSLVKEITKEDPILQEATVLDLIFPILIGGFEVNTLAVASAFRFLTENSDVVERLEDENEEIMKKTRERPDSEIKWEDYKMMRFTQLVVYEIYRLTSISGGFFRTVLKDVEYKGYTIPEGWKVVVYTPAIHLNPKIYEDPLSFNPSRWQDNNGRRPTQNYLAFGFGQRFCAGADYSVLVLSIFLHYLTANYRWKIIKGGKVTRTSVSISFPEGFHIQLLPKA